MIHNDTVEHYRQDSDSITPPSSPAVNRLKEIFPTKSPLVRKDSRFSVGKVSLF